MIVALTLMTLTAIRGRQLPRPEGESPMHHALATTHVAYTHIPWEHVARAHCYCCGTEMPAASMVWMRGITDEAYRALCAPCCAADAVGRRAEPIL